MRYQSTLCNFTLHHVISIDIMRPQVFAGGVDDISTTTDQWLTVTELAQKVQLSGETIRRLVRAKRIPHLRIGHNIRFSPEHLAEIERLYEVRPAPLGPVRGSRRAS